MKTLIIIFFFYLLGCQTKKTNSLSSTPTNQIELVNTNEPDNTPPSPDSNAHISDADSNPDLNSNTSFFQNQINIPNENQENPTSELQSSKIKSIKTPKIGLILGPGGARTMAFVGLLHQLRRQKFPIHAIVGIEMGAPIAALYAEKESPNDVEWQIFKLREEDLGQSQLLRLKNEPLYNEFESMNRFLKIAFGNIQSNELRIPFSCPAYNLARNQNFMMSFGGIRDLVELCTPYPPIFKPYRQNISGIREIKASSKYLKSKGAQFIILANVLNGPPNQKFFSNDKSLEEIIWKEISSVYNRTLLNSENGIDSVINIPVNEFGISEFQQKKEIILKGSSCCSNEIIKISQKIGI